MDIYIVQAGDTIDRIASSYGIEVSAIIYANQMIYPYKLAIGQALVIPLGKRKATRISYIKGYAYPFISQEVLEQTLPYLSDLSIFSYGFTTTGELIPPKIEEQWLISKAWQTKTLPIMTLTPLDEKGNFNNYLITSVVNDIEIRTYFIENILYLVKTKGYAGVDVDFEYIRAQDKDAFSEFVKELTIIMNKNG